jgi:arabinofuranosyltransferase
VQTTGVAAEPTAPATQTVASTESSAHRLLRWALLVAPVLVYLERAWSRRWMSDDGFIYLRVVDMLEVGHGPVFNAGERVEAATGPVWVGMLTVADVVTPFRLEWIAVLGGIGLSIFGMASLIAGSRRLVGVTGAGLAVPAGAAVLVATPPMWTFASSGLETGLSFGWLGTCLWLLARWARDRDRVAAWELVILGLGPIIRPDLGLFTVAFAVVLLTLGSTTWLDRARVAGWMFALPVLYQIFRMGYYGQLVPNPATAKEASDERWDVGWDYLRSSTDAYWLWFAVLILAVGAYVPLVAALRGDGRRRELFVTAAFVIAGMLHVVYIVRVGGDFFHARLLLPGLVAIAAPVAVVPARRQYAVSLLLVPWFVAALFFLRSDRDVYDSFGVGRKNPITVDDFGWGDDGPFRQFFTGPGVYYSDQRLDAQPVAEHDREIASYGVGIVGYALGPDVYVLDLLGLGDAFTAHLELDERGVPAHEKPLPAPWIVARLTPPGTDLDADDLPPVFGPRPLDDPRGQAFDARVEQARRALACAGFTDFEASYSGSLTPGRFLGNLVDSFSNTRFRIPPEPRDAVAEFC